MEHKEIIIKYDEYNEGDKLPKDDSNLIAKANEAVKSSYAPYSEFHVGAALLLEDGQIIMGSNQENAAYPSGLCAERVALFHTKSSFPDAIISSIAITCRSDNFVVNEPVAPCGACRQVIAETEKRQERRIRIIMSGESGKTRIVEGIDSLLPMKFHEEKLKKINR